MREASAISSVKLELLRSGPAHNQLLSPLTSYIALCGSDGPVTLNMPFEQRQLLSRLQRLRYQMDRSQTSEDQRQSELRDLGEVIGKVLGLVPGLLSELGSASSTNGRLVHLRLVMSAFELGMVPFETAIAAEGFPGAGSPLFLQTRMPICVTREFRRGRPLPIEWNREPRILFAFAAPDGLYVPAESHLQALREAIDPWVRIEEDPKARVEEVKKHLTVLPNASLEQIRTLCASGEFTHVHILAHGKSFRHCGEERYGLALCAEGGTAVDVVDGERLAIALIASDPLGHSHRPTLVSLATCDSGNIDSPLTPGGSIAHELHAAGIPWVIASQFPLWMKASAVAVRELYSGLLKGADPRWVLYELRQRLRTDVPETHDWASIVAYSTVSRDFEQQVSQFRDQQTRRRIEVKFDRIDELVGANNEAGVERLGLTEAQKQELTPLSTAIRADLESWRAESGCVTPGNTEMAYRFGISGACEKRLGIAFNQIDESAEQRAYEACRDFYFQAWKLDPCNHWVITQCLAIRAILALREDEEGRPTDRIEQEARQLAADYGVIWQAVRQVVDWRICNLSGREQAYAYSTQAELDLLGTVYAGAASGEALKGQLVLNCKALRERSVTNAQPLVSARRQFRRYLQDWPSPLWNDLASAALEHLSQ